MALSWILILFCFVVIGVHGQGLKAPNRFKAPINCQFSGTFALCTNAWPENLPLQITELTIHGVPAPTITSDHIQSLPPNLSALRIYNCGIQQVESNTFDPLRNYLQELELANNEISSIPSALFGNMKRLKKIVLRNNSISDLNRATFAGLNNLETLDLSQNRMTEMPRDLPSQMQELYLANNPIQRLESVPLDNLQSLNLCGTQIDEFPNSNKIKSGKLQILCLGGRNLKSSSTGFRKLPELIELTLVGQEGSSRNDMPPDVLDSLKDCTKLQRLAIEKYDLPSLTVLKNFRELHTLVLREVFVQDKPTASVFRPLENLQVVDFSNSARLVQQTLLVQEIRQTWYTVTSLNVRNTQLQDLGWYSSQQSTINGLPSLSSIDISGNPINCSSPVNQQVLCHFIELAKNPSIDPRYYPVPTTPDPVTQMQIIPQSPYFVPQWPGMQHMEQTCDRNTQMNTDCSSFTTVPTAPPLASTTSFLNPVTESIRQSELTTAQKWYIVLGVILLLLAIVTIVVIYLYCRKVDEDVQNSAEVEAAPSKAEAKSFKELKEQEGSTVNLVKE